MSSDRAIKIFLIDGDIVFLEGLRQVLKSQNDMTIIAQAENLQKAREQLSSLEALPNILILDIHLTDEETITPSMEFCQEIKQAYPNLPLFLLTTVTDGKILGSFRRLGIEGYARKRTAVEELINALRQVARGELYWQQGITSESYSLQLSPPASPQPVTPPRWLTRQRETGLSEIEKNLAQVEANLNKEDLSTFDWLFWQGLRRELRVAQWMVKQLLPVEVVVVNEEKTEQEEDKPPQSEITPPQLTAFPTSVSETLFQTTLGKIQLGLVNQTDYTLEIDLLNAEKKRELLYLVVQQFQELLQQLKFIQLPIENLSERRSRLLREVWQNCLSKWISNYIPETEIYQLAPSISDFMLREVPFVEQTNLNKIPQVSPLFAYLLYQQPLEIDQVSYRPESPEAQSRAEILFHHLILQIANAVMQVILNQFGEQETIKTTLYQEKYCSSRAIARFRNELSWQYRRFYYIEEPKAIFESRHDLLVLRGNRIQSISVYAPRQAELEELQGLRWSVTISLELRDAIAPRIRSVFSIVGQAAVYVLTQVIGRGIGLIGRGILQGIGKSVEDQRNQR